MPHPLRNILNGLLWAKDPNQYLLAYVHRGIEGDLAIIKVSEISKVGKSWFTLKDSDAIIPFHRIAWIKGAAGRAIWEARVGTTAGSGTSGRGPRRPARRARPNPL